MQADGRRSWVADSLLIFLLAALLIWPLFRLEYSANWASIESTFIADARFLRDHWPHPNWQPLWYGGTRFDYIYPPALRYGTAALAKYLGVEPARAYHFYTALFYCVGIVGVYLLIRTGSRRRGSAWLGTAAVALLSPCFLFMTHLRNDAWRLTPQRLSALVRYGEGPHMTALAVLPLALAAAFIGLRRRHPAALALAAVFSALVVSNNFYGATALAIFFPILVWSLWVTHQDHRVWLRAAAIAALAYGLTAFWLVPSYFRVTSENLRLVAEPGNWWSVCLALAVAAAFAAVSWKLARARPERAWLVFASGAALFFSLNVLGQYCFNFRVAGEPERMAPELDLALILIALEALKWLWACRPARGLRWLPKAVAVAAVLVSFSASRQFVPRAWDLYEPDPDFRRRLEFRLAEWVARNLPGARNMVTGSVRFWYNNWHDLPQLGGGSEQGLLNPNTMPAQWEISGGEAPGPAIQWMQCLGVDAVTVHDKSSEEVYHDFSFPQKFARALPAVYDDQKGNAIYRVPRRYPGLARVVEKTRIERLAPLGGSDDSVTLGAYAEAVERGPDSPTTTDWQGTDALRVRATVRAGEAVLVQVSYDPAWRAYSNGRRLRIAKDVLGQMLIDTPPGMHDLRLVFETPLENRVGRLISLASGLTVIALVAAGLRRKEVKA